MSEDIGPDLVTEARGGDPEALNTLVTRAYPIVRRCARVHTGDPAEADHLTQDVLRRVTRRLDAYQGDARFTTWLYAVTRHAAADRFRRRDRRRRLEGDPRAAPELAPRPRPSSEAQLRAGRPPPRRGGPGARRHGSGRWLGRGTLRICAADPPEPSTRLVGGGRHSRGVGPAAHDPGPHARAARPFVARTASAPPIVRAAPDQNVAVFQTDDPNITVLWFF